MLFTSLRRIAYENRYVTHSLVAFESLIKIKVMLHWTLLVFLLTSALISNNKFCGARLCNNFKTVNAITLVKTVLKLALSH